MSDQRNGTPAAAVGRGRSISCTCRCGSVELPELPDIGDVLSGLDDIADADKERSPTEVGVDGVHPVAVVDDEVVAEDEAGAAELSRGTLDDEHVGERRPRPRDRWSRWRPDAQERPVGHGQDRRAEASGTGRAGAGRSASRPGPARREGGGAGCRWRRSARRP